MQLFGLLDLVGQHPQDGGQGPGLPVDQRRIEYVAPLGDGRALHIEQIGHRHRQARRRDKPCGRGAQAVEGALHIPVVPEALEEGGDDENDDDGGGDEPQGGHHRPQEGKGQAALAHAGEVAHVGGHIHADGAGGGLAHGDHVVHVHAGDPAGGVGHVVEEGDGGHAAAYGEQARLEELIKQPQIDHALFTPAFFSTTPAAAAASTNHTGLQARAVLRPNTRKKMTAVGMSMTDF